MKRAVRISSATVLITGLMAVQGIQGKELGIGQRPESATKGFDGDYFVTVMQGEDEPGDGLVRRVSGDQVTEFATGLDEPKGITFTGEFLVTTDVTKVWKIDAEGNKSVLAAEDAFPEEVRYLNDAAAAPDGQSVFISDMGANDRMFGPQGLWPLDSEEAEEIPAVGRIYEITLDGEVRIAVEADPKILNPNGVTVANDNSLLIAEFFKGNIVRARNGELEVLNSGFRGGDGIEQDSEGNLYLSSWTQGKVWKLDPDAQNAELIRSGFYSAADFYLDEEENGLIIPDMLAGMLFFVPLDE